MHRKFYYKRLLKDSAGENFFLNSKFNSYAFWMSFCPNKCCINEANLKILSESNTTFLVDTFSKHGFIFFRQIDKSSFDSSSARIHAFGGTKNLSQNLHLYIVPSMWLL